MRPSLSHLSVSTDRSIEEDESKRGASGLCKQSNSPFTVWCSKTILRSDFSFLFTGVNSLYFTERVIKIGAVCDHMQQLWGTD